MLDFTHLQASLDLEERYNKPGEFIWPKKLNTRESVPFDYEYFLWAYLKEGVRPFPLLTSLTVREPFCGQGPLEGD